VKKQCKTALKDKAYKMFGDRILGFPGMGDSSPKNIMTNADRRNMGIEQDPELPDYKRRRKE